MMTTSRADGFSPGCEGRHSSSYWCRTSFPARNGRRWHFQATRILDPKSTAGWQPHWQRGFERKCRRGLDHRSLLRPSRCVVALVTSATDMVAGSGGVATLILRSELPQCLSAQHGIDRRT